MGASEQAEEPVRRAPPDGARPSWRVRLRSSLPVGLAAAALAVALVAASVSADPARWPSERGFAVWFALLLLSFDGWGTLAVLAFGAASIRGFLRIAFGVAALVAVSGFFLAAHVLSFGVLAALVVVGATAEFWRLFQAAARFARARAGGAMPFERSPRPSVGEVAYGIAAAVVLLAACLRVVGSAELILPWWNADDAPAYWGFIRELTQRGAFDQAYSFRRMVAFGGQTVLQAVTCLGVPVRSANVFDAGLCPFLMSGVLLQVGRGRWLAIAAALLVVLLPNTAMNSASNFSGSLLFLVVYFSLRFASARSLRRGGALTGMTAAALCTLRHSFIPGCGVLLAAAALAHLSNGGSKTRREAFGFCATTAGAFALTIAPWSLASLVASHTPLFPLFNGTYQGGGVDLGTSGGSWLGGLAGIFGAAAPVPELLIVFAALLALGSGLSRGALVPLALGALACTLALARTAPLNPADDVRYLAAPWLGVVIAFYCEAPLEPAGAETTRRSLPLAGVAVVLVALQLGPSLAPGTSALYDDDRIRLTWPLWAGEKASTVIARRLQAQVPAGKTLLTACDQVYRYDFSRNKLLLVDLPNVASPFPLPGEHATPAEYERTIAEFGKRGIDYLLFTNPDASNALYSGPRWESFRNDGYRTHELLVPRFAAWAGFERYVLAHRRIVARAGIDVLADFRVKSGS